MPDAPRENEDGLPGAEPDPPALIVPQFDAGPAGVGPATGLDSGEFFPGPALEVTDDQ